MNDQCQAFTRRWFHCRCKRRAMVDLAGYHYCRQHAKAVLVANGNTSAAEVEDD